MTWLATGTNLAQRVDHVRVRLLGLELKIDLRCLATAQVQPRRIGNDAYCAESHLLVNYFGRGEEERHKIENLPLSLWCRGALKRLAKTLMKERGYVDENVD